MKIKRIVAVGLAAAAPAAMAEGGLKLISFSTLIGEIVTFGILVYVVMKFVWPPLMNAVATRQKEIADGLAAGEQGRQDLAAAKDRKDELLGDARAKAGVLIADGEKRKSDIVDSARAVAESEKERILEHGRRELEMERSAMCRELEHKVGELAVAGASKILAREVDASTHADIVESLKQSMRP